jgi:hypothetical protein
MNKSRPKILRMDSSTRKPTPVCIKLTITLKFLATGDSYKRQKFLSPLFPPDIENFQRIGRRFETVHEQQQKLTRFTYWYLCNKQQIVSQIVGRDLIWGTSRTFRELFKMQMYSCKISASQKHLICFIGGFGKCSCSWRNISRIPDSTVAFYGLLHV